MICSGHSLRGNYDDGSLPENKKEGDVRYFFLSGKLSMREKFGVGWGMSNHDQNSIKIIWYCHVKRQLPKKIGIF